MPPKKKNAQRAPPPPPPVVSDYDTDAANYTDNAAYQLPITAPPPNRTNEELNMLVLKRWYPEVEQIIAIAPFAVIYTCNPETGIWDKDKTDIQGTLFVCQTAAEDGGYPGYKAIILNRRHMENWELELISTENIEVADEFVICTVLETAVTEEGEGYETATIYGIWMFQDTEGGKEVIAEVVRKLLECAKRAEQYALLAEEANGGHNGYQQEYDQYEYGLDGMPRRESYGAEQQRYEQPLQQQQHHEAAFEAAFRAPQQMPSMSGQQIDLATLFAKPQQPQQPPHQMQAPMYPPQNHGDGQSARFAHAADTDFFRGSPNPTIQQQQGPPPNVQQNALLNLFKNANKG